MSKFSTPPLDTSNMLPKASQTRTLDPPKAPRMGFHNHQRSKSILCAGGYLGDLVFSTLPLDCALPRGTQNCKYYYKHAHARRYTTQQIALSVQHTTHNTQHSRTRQRHMPPDTRIHAHTTHNHTLTQTQTQFETMNTLPDSPQNPMLD